MTRVSALLLGLLVFALCVVVTVLRDAPHHYALAMLAPWALWQRNEAMLWGLCALWAVISAAVWMVPWYVAFAPLAIPLAWTRFHRRHMDMSQWVLRAVWYLGVAATASALQYVIYALHFRAFELWPFIVEWSTATMSVTVAILCGDGLLRASMRPRVSVAL